MLLLETKRHFAFSIEATDTCPQGGSGDFCILERKKNEQANLCTCLERPVTLCVLMWAQIVHVFEQKAIKAFWVNTRHFIISFNGCCVPLQLVGEGSLLYMLNSLPGICWHLEQPLFGCTQELKSSIQGGESWLGFPQGDTFLAGLPRSQRGCAKLEETTALQWLHHSPASRKAVPPHCQGWTSVPSPLSFPPGYSGEKKLTWMKRNALRDKSRYPSEKWVL